MSTKRAQKQRKTQRIHQTIDTFYACKRSFCVICIFMNKSEQRTNLRYYYVDLVVYAYHTRITGFEIHSF